MPHTNPTVAEDFVLVENVADTSPLQDSPSASENTNCPDPTSSEGADCDFPISPTLDTVEGDVSVSSGDESEEVMLDVECFASMRPSDFPEEFIQNALIFPAEVLTEKQEDKAHEPATVLLGNAEVLFQCCLHFYDVYSKLGNDSFLDLIGKACRFKIENPVPIRRRVNQAINTLIEGRLASSGPHLASATNYEAQNLARLVDDYIFLDKPDSSEQLEKWHEDPRVRSLCHDWQRIMEVVEDPKSITGKEEIIHSDSYQLLADTCTDRSQRDKFVPRDSHRIAASHGSCMLFDAYNRLQTSVESGTLDEYERLKIRRALLFAKKTTQIIEHSLDYKYL